MLNSYQIGLILSQNDKFKYSIFNENEEHGLLAWIFPARLVKARLASNNDFHMGYIDGEWIEHEEQEL